MCADTDATQQQFEAEVMHELRQEMDEHDAREAMLEERRRQDAKIIQRKMNECLQSNQRRPS